MHRAGLVTHHSKRSHLVVSTKIPSGVFSVVAVPEIVWVGATFPSTVLALSKTRIELAPAPVVNEFAT